MRRGIFTENYSQACYITTVGLGSNRDRGNMRTAKGSVGFVLKLFRARNSSGHSIQCQITREITTAIVDLIDLK
jgi:hypothetical protein